jgi:FkbM family methyltransferase
MKVFVYGAGDMGVEASKILTKNNIEVEAFIDKNPVIQGEFINNIKVMNISQIPEERKKDAIFAISVVKFPYNDIKRDLENAGCQNIIYVGDLIKQVYKGPSVANVWRLNNITEDEADKLKYINSMYSDENSRRASCQIIRWLEDRVEDIQEGAMGKFDEKYFIDKIRNILIKDEVFIDCGAYTGTTIKKIKEYAYYKTIYAFEPDNENYKKLKEFIKQDGDNNKIIAYNFGLGDIDGNKKFTSGLGIHARYSDEYGTEFIPIYKLDTIMSDKSYTFLKIYGIGNGLEVLEGGLETIRKNRPIITIKINHSRKNFIEIPYFIMKNFANYSFYLRLHEYCGNDAVIYAIPKEREYES